MKTIAPLGTFSNALDTASKFVRVLDTAGVTSSQLLLPINSKAARRNLAEYLAAGCPKMGGEGVILHSPAKPKVWGGLLEDVGEPIRLPFVERFVASEKFVEGATIDGIRIAQIGRNFKENLLGAEYANVKSITVQQRKLLGSATSREVYTARGGNGLNAIARSSIALVHVWEFLKMASRAERHLFFSHGWAVNADWDGGGLRVGADPLVVPVVWNAGSRFLSLILPIAALSDPLTLCCFGDIGAGGHSILYLELCYDADMDKEIRISITSGTVITALLITAGAYVLWLLRDLVLLVLTAIVIASAIEPEIAFFIRHRIPRFFAAILVYVLVFGSFFAILFFFFPPIIADAAGFLSAMPRYLDTLKASGSLPNITSATNLIGGSHDLQSFIQTLFSLQSLFTAGSGSIVQLFVTFFGGILSLTLVIVLSFYFALQDTGVDDFLRMVMPVAYEEYSVDLWKRAQKKIGLWMQGQILLSVLVAILVYLGLLITGVPYALLLAVFTAMAEIIPIFGSLIAGTIAVIVAYSNSGVALGAIVAGLYIVVNQFESNLIYPLIVKKIVGVPPLLVIVALVAGYTLAGFLGVLLSVPVAAVLLEFITDFDKRKRREHKSA